jgi:hypothetical protein
MGTGNRVAAELNAGQLQQGLQPLAHRSLHDDRRRFPHRVGDLAAASSQYTTLVLGFRNGDRHARPRFRLADLGVPVTSRMGVALQRSDLFTDPTSSARRGARLGTATTATRTPKSRPGRHPADHALTYYGTKFDTFELFDRAGPSTRATAPSSPTEARVTVSAANRFVHAAGQRHRVLRACGYDYLQFVPARQVVHADVQPRGQLTPMRARRHDLDAPVPPVLCRRTGELCAATAKAGIGPEGFLRQPVRRQHQAHEPARAAAADAGPSGATAPASALFADAGNVFANDDVNYVGRDGIHARVL